MLARFGLVQPLKRAYIGYQDFWDKSLGWFLRFRLFINGSVNRTAPAIPGLLITVHMIRYTCMVWVFLFSYKPFYASLIVVIL